MVRWLSTTATVTDVSPRHSEVPPADSSALPFIGDVGLFGLHYRYSFRAFREITQHNFNVEIMAGIRARIQVIRPHYIHGDWLICFRGTQTVPTAAGNCWLMMSMQTVPVAACNKRSTPRQRIVTRIIRDISRCPHGPVVNKLYWPAP